MQSKTHNGRHVIDTKEFTWKNVKFSLTIWICSIVNQDYEACVCYSYPCFYFPCAWPCIPWHSNWILPVHGMHSLTFPLNIPCAWPCITWHSPWTFPVHGHALPDFPHEHSLCMTMHSLTYPVHGHAFPDIPVEHSQCMAMLSLIYPVHGYAFPEIPVEHFPLDNSRQLRDTPSTDPMSCCLTVCWHKGFEVKENCRRSYQLHFSCTVLVSHHLHDYARHRRGSSWCQTSALPILRLMYSYCCSLPQYGQSRQRLMLRECLTVNECATHSL